jgi:lipoprotein-releasing system permease protein
LGNLIGLGFGAIQYFTQIIKLNAENYYMSYVPIYWNWMIILGMNLLILLVTTIILFVPAMAISNIKPIKAIRFD